MSHDKAAEVLKCRRCPMAYHLECLPKKIMGTMNKLGKRVWIAKGKDADGAWQLLEASRKSYIAGA